jgi:hypothetical protein
MAGTASCREVARFQQVIAEAKQGVRDYSQRLIALYTQ